MPRPRQSAPIRRPDDTEADKRNAELPIEEQIANARDKDEEEAAEDKMDTDDKSKQPDNDASVGDKRERAEEHEDKQSSHANGDKSAPKKPKVTEEDAEPKKKAGRPKREDAKAHQPSERKNSISSRTRSKAPAEEAD
ncbi:hypothetical protein ABW21_db0204282 [Orbilia brochopaga]|nr:hypothetical protein ABW21_db0204282 [Drechslerella brochopaga]